ncbi:MAG TPA: 2'-5' RNA ligase family protein [Flavisolibacter sp.]|nr:2'-5' RNA ligase family protein [Flavisolibacter sp.]
MEVPLILTLALEEYAFQFFNALRKIYYPAHLNKADAHLTLFHLLPSHDSVIEKVATMAAHQNTITLQVKEPILTSTGVSYTIESDCLMQLHRDFQRSWESFLIPQDREELWPHITIQSQANKEESGELLQFLTSNFSGFDAIGTGLQLWENQGGKMKLFREFPFIKD